MRLTFPHMGDLQIPMETLLNEVGIEAVPPPPINQETILLGTQHSPEFICYPFKINLGNYLQAIQAGADGILMAGGCGPCRFGHYAEVQREILWGLGHHVDFVILEPPKSEGSPFYLELGKILGMRGTIRLPGAIRLAWEKIKCLDHLTEIVHWLMPREKTPGSALAMRRRWRRQIANATEIKVLTAFQEMIRAEAESMAFPREETPLRIRICGEIYMVLEPEVNFHVEDILGGMGVEVLREINISNWVRDNLLRGFNRVKIQHMASQAEDYLRCFVGGHGQHTVAETVEAGTHHEDGIIQILPFTCMPELVAQSILPEISRDFGLPVLSLVIDEHAGEAGVRTRLEAFVDLIHRRRAVEGSKYAMQRAERRTTTRFEPRYALQ